MNKVVKRILKIVGIAIAVIVVVLIGYIIYLYASYHRIEDNKKLKVESRIEQSKASEKLSTGKEYSALTYNIGFGAYTPVSVSLWMAVSHHGQRARKVLSQLLTAQVSWLSHIILILP